MSATNTTTPIVKTEPWKFLVPYYIIRAVDTNNTGMVSKWSWPESGAIDDRQNFNSEVVCGQGLYGFSIKHIMNPMTVFYSSHLKNATKYFILEVEETEIVDEGDKCKVPRCNVYSVFTKENYYSFLEQWHYLLTNKCFETNIKFQELYEKFCKKINVKILTQADKQTIISWCKNNNNRRKRKYGDGCASSEELAEFKRLKNLLISENEVALSEKEISELGKFINSTQCSGAILFLWKKLQKNLDNLFNVHPLIEQTMIKVAEVADTPEYYKFYTYKASEYHNPFGMKIPNPLISFYPYEKNEEIKEIKNILKQYFSTEQLEDLYNQIEFLRSYSK